jgi:hypothetical protein
MDRGDPTASGGFAFGGEENGNAIGHANGHGIPCPNAHDGIGLHLQELRGSASRLGHRPTVDLLRLEEATVFEADLAREGLLPFSERNRISQRGEIARSTRRESMTKARFFEDGCAKEQRPAAYP